jgi:hypothetical protein
VKIQYHARYGQSWQAFKLNPAFSVASQKVDLYSLGIVFFEMTHAFRTGHERVMCIQVCRVLAAPVGTPQAADAACFESIHESSRDYFK